MVYTWSMPLLNFALQDVALDDKLASFIYHYAVKRGLMDLMKFAHENGADTIDGCKFAAESGHVECLN